MQDPDAGETGVVVSTLEISGSGSGAAGVHTREKDRDDSDVAVTRGSISSDTIADASSFRSQSRKKVATGDDASAAAGSEHELEQGVTAASDHVDARSKKFTPEVIIRGKCMGRVWNSGLG